eukprot:CAMPEP_0195510052 /NCGR_PEP_ID=MMETSP0794_2-20130614/2815_1 /TAXON_ID=515487 /ORGANISM="Stephanopyxis turris, Strain CCMP 815" /LENGTH=333 /DNA_ID=CAMNT_0040637403 /DNA_START=10 /DNA_END=1011 /DNA_ORIENTATION=-
MSSQQMSAGAGKAAKFTAANPLAPMADPFAGLGDDEKEYQKVLSDNVNKRMTKALEDLAEKHSKGINEIDDEDRAPTGGAYRTHNAQLMKQRRQIEAEKEVQRNEEVKRLLALKDQARRLNGDGKQNHDDDSSCCSDSDDDEYDHLLDDDPELEAIRNNRLQQIRDSQMKQAENLGKGHGQYRLIYQDDFLHECTGSEYVAAHFFHKEFQRCKIMDHHLELIAPLHVDCKFVKIDAEKAPFFVDKLQIKTLPTLFVFQNGKVVDRLTGFEGLAANPNDPDNWHTGKLQQWLANTGAIDYKIPTEDVLNEMKRLGIQPKGAIWSTKKNSVWEDE